MSKKDRTQDGAADREDNHKGKKLKREIYETKLAELHMELVKMQYWIKAAGKKLVVIFEGRDAAGKGGAVKCISEPLNPRGSRIVALGTPTATEKTQWYFQRYVAHLPAAGEIVLFDRSWYNPAVKNTASKVVKFMDTRLDGLILRAGPLFHDLDLVRRQTVQLVNQLVDLPVRRLDSPCDAQGRT